MNDFSLTSWESRLDLVPVSCSSALINCSLSLDGDDVTYWEADGSNQVFVVVDFGDKRSVNSVGILTSDTNGESIVAVIQNGESPDGPFVTSEVSLLTNSIEKQWIYLVTRLIYS